MAGLFSIFGTNKYLCPLEEHSNCHVVVDGSNLQYFFSSRKHALTNLPAYEEAARNFFQQMLNAGITPHVFFDGPSRSDPYKWERGRKRRHDRLRRLMEHVTEYREFEYPQPTAIQDIFRDVIHSLGIRAIQVSAKRDYLVEMVFQAKHLDALLISGNTKFFLEDIRRGFVCPKTGMLADIDPESRFIMRTFHFDKLSHMVGLERSRNKHALTMWRSVMFEQKTFEDFTKRFFPNNGRRGDICPRGYCLWMQDLLPKYDRAKVITRLKMLQFFLENSYVEAERIVFGLLLPGVRKDAELFFRQNVAAHSLEPYDVFEHIEEEIESGSFCEEDLPRWFLRYLTVEFKVIPGLMDTITDRRHHLLAFVEDFERESVNETTLRIRRIIYGILLCDFEDNEIIKIAELDRVGGELEEIDQTPIWQLWNPDNQREPREVPGLKEMESLSELERLELFLLSMGIDENFHREVQSREALYVMVILRYWIVASKGLKKRDFLKVLLTILLVEAEYKKSSKVFRDSVQLKENARSDLNIEFCPEKLAVAHESLSVMHAHSQLQNVMVFARVLHRLYMQPLGATVDGIETITSEVVFYQISQLTDGFSDEEVETFVLDQVDEMSKENFTQTVDFIWNRDALRLGKLIFKGFRGDDKRP